METKEMRAALKKAGITCPVKNIDVIEAFNKMNGIDGLPETTVAVVNEKPKDSVVKLATSNVYTYIGSGDEPPHMINFMGRQQFVRGQPTEVTDPEVAEKVSHHRCFVKGKIDTQIMFANDEIEKAKAQAQRDEDVKTQIMADRKNVG